MSILPQSNRIAGAPRELIHRLLPNRCLCCGAAASEILCSACITALPRLPPAVCPRCAEPGTAGQPCADCLRQAPEFSACSAPFSYTFPVDRLIQALKYAHRLALAPWFARQIAVLLEASTFDRIMPLPLHPQRLRERGFNQAQEMARQLAADFGVRLDSHSLQRIRRTATQAELPLNARAANVRGAFACMDDLNGQRVLLLDDVLTSGATANECARVLRLHGATSVHVAVVARALKR